MKSNSFWQKVSEEEKEKIRQESNSLLNEFALKLSKIKSIEKHYENGDGMREEGSGWETDEEFRNTMFANAPFVDDNFIVAEKGEWKK